MPRELKNLGAVIAKTEKFGMGEDRLVDMVSQITVAWSWGRSDADIAEQANRVTQHSN